VSPVGLRVALRFPVRICALITQNGDAYVDFALETQAAEIGREIREFLKANPLRRIFNSCHEPFQVA
jgi:hypothetical protein